MWHACQSQHLTQKAGIHALTSAWACHCHTGRPSNQIPAPSCMRCWPETDRWHSDMVEEMTEGEVDWLEGEQHLIWPHALLKNILRTAVQPLRVQHASLAGQQVCRALRSPKQAHS